MFFSFQTETDRIFNFKHAYWILYDVWRVFLCFQVKIFRYLYLQAACNTLPLTHNALPLTRRVHRTPTYLLQTTRLLFHGKHLSVVSRVGFWVGPGSGLSLSKCFGPISGLHIKLFHDIQSNDFFFRDVHLLSSPRWLLWVKWLWFS